MKRTELKDFSLGITDDYIDCDPKAYEKADNLLINRYKKLFQRPGFTIYSTDAPQLPPGNQRVDDLYYFDSTLFAKSGTNLYFMDDGDTAWTHLQTVATKAAFKDSELGARLSWSEWNGHLFITPGESANNVDGCRTVKVYRNGSGTWTCAQAGVPRAMHTAEDPPGDATWGTTPAAASHAGGEDYNYLYAIVFRISYTAQVNGQNVTFEEWGTPKILQATEALPESATVSFGTVTYTNGTDDSYDTANMRVHVYRTKKDGDILYYATGFALGAAISDDDTDEELGAEFYAPTGEEVYNDHPGQTYLSMIVDGHGWYGAVTDLDDSQFYNGRFLQSNALVVDGVPAGNYGEVDGKLVACSYVNHYPLYFTEQKTYRVEGRLDAYGNGDLRAVVVSDTEGSVSQEVVRTREGVYFCSRSGVCFTDGFKVVKLSDHLRTTYGTTLVTKSRMTGCYDSDARRVWWGAEHDDYTGSTNNMCLILDEFWSKFHSRGVFTTASSRTTESSPGDNLKPNALHYDPENKVILIGDQHGYIFKFDASTYYDPIVNTAAAWATWNVQSIVHDFISAGMNFGTDLLTKWFTRIFVVAKAMQDYFNLDFSVHKDDNDTAGTCTTIRMSEASKDGLWKTFRWFPKTFLRAIYMQIEAKKGYNILYNSDTHGTIDTTGSNATLGKSWPDHENQDLVGHFLYTSDDSYATGYRIASVSGAVATVTGTLPTGSGLSWYIKGYTKEEQHEIHSLGIENRVEGQTYTAYDGVDGSNA